MNIPEQFILKDLTPPSEDPVPEEQCALAYYRKTGKIMDLLQLLFLKNTDSLEDLSILETEWEGKFRRALFAEYGSYSDVLNAMLKFPPEQNVHIRLIARHIKTAPHSHDFFDIIYVADGSALITVDKETRLLSKGDVTVCPPGFIHSYVPNGDCTVFGIYIKEETFSGIFHTFLSEENILSSYFINNIYSHNYKSALHFHCGNDKFLSQFLWAIYNQQQNGLKYYSQINDALTFAFFYYLMQAYEQTIDFTAVSGTPEERIIAIENYIRSNYQSATLTSTAEHFFLSPAYLSTLIKEQTGKNFSQIVRSLRMQRAGELLLATDLKVDQITESVGYHDTTQFIKSFKAHYGTTPSKYRSQRKKGLM